MRKYVTLAGLILVSSGCRENSIKDNQPQKIDNNVIERIYSKTVGDSFSISINLPAEYSATKTDKYPVVIVLDANLYFDILSTIVKKYSEVGLSPSVILVGVGYKDFSEMDSLRERDYTYPTAIPKYEMKNSGGAEKFLSFITHELIPDLDKSYRTDTSNRVLMGHSLSGYFTTYALYQNLSGKESTFTHYVSASPSLHYNDYYLLEQKQLQLSSDKSKVTAYFTFGGLENTEDEEENERKVEQVLKQLSILLKPTGLNYKADIFSNLGHMDTPIPGFIKGLQWSLMKNEEGK